jgi:valyl-tRNA synthetase
MSKVKGNVLDPIQVIEKYGTDATRFTLAAMSSPGTDIAFNESRTEGYRAFANKIWNAARFMFMNMERLGLCGSDILVSCGADSCGADTSVREKSSSDSRPQRAGLETRPYMGIIASTLEDQWIRSRFNSVAKSVNESLTAYRFDEGANLIYDFFWGEFCDWYIELIKPRLAPEDRVSKPGGSFRGFPAPPPTRHALHHRRTLACDLRWQAAAEIVGPGGLSAS